jgi:hypothetical protein
VDGLVIVGPMFTITTTAPRRTTLNLPTTRLPRPSTYRITRNAITEHFSEVADSEPRQADCRYCTVPLTGR